MDGTRSVGRSTDRGPSFSAGRSGSCRSFAVDAALGGSTRVRSAVRLAPWLFDNCIRSNASAGGSMACVRGASWLAEPS